MALRERIFTLQKAPPIELPDPAAQFMELHLANVDPIFASLDIPSYIEQQNKGNASRSLSLADTPEVLAAKDAFLKAVDEFNGSKARNELEVAAVMIPGRPEVHTWLDIMSTLREAEQQYLEPKDKNRRERIRGWLRKCGELEGPVTSWMRLLPSESWQGSLLCGGLKVILTAAVRLRDLRDEIGTAIEQIPLSIQSAEKLCKIYHADVEMYGKELVIASLEVMQACVLWFAHNCFKKVLGAVARGKDYAKSLSKKIADLQKLQARMDRAASTAFQMAQHTARESDNLRGVQMISGLRQIQESVIDDTNMSRDNNYILRGVHQLLQDSVQRFERCAQIEALMAKKEIRRRDRDALAQDRKGTLLAYLDFNAETSMADLSLCLRIGSSLAHEIQSRAAYILDTSEMHEWTSTEQSATLVVNAQEPARLVTHSTASFFSTMLVSALEESVQGVVLYRFCAQHPRDAPVAMVADLLGQLLDKGLDHVGPEDLALPPGVKSWSYVSWTYENLKVLLLKYLRLQLRATDVYCVLDTVSMYEDNGRVRELLDLWTSLDSLGRFEDERQHSLKLMATSPSRSLHIGTRRDPAQPTVLVAPRQIPGREKNVASAYSGFREGL